MQIKEIIIFSAASFVITLFQFVVCNIFFIVAMQVQGPFGTHEWSNVGMGKHRIFVGMQVQN
jgi:hypothetical protein